MEESKDHLKPQDEEFKRLQRENANLKERILQMEEPASEPEAEEDHHWGVFFILTEGYGMRALTSGLCWREMGFFRV